MNKVQTQIWEKEKKSGTIRMEIPANCEAADLYSATFEFHQAVINLINDLNSKLQKDFEVNSKSVSPEEPAEVPAEAVK